MFPDKSKMSIKKFKEELKRLEKEEREYRWYCLNKMVEARLPSDVESKNEIRTKENVEYTKGKQAPDNSRKPNM